MTDDSPQAATESDPLPKPSPNATINWAEKMHAGEIFLAQVAQQFLGHASLGDAAKAYLDELFPAVAAKK